MNSCLNKLLSQSNIKYGNLLRLSATAFTTFLTTIRENSSSEKSMNIGKNAMHWLEARSDLMLCKILSSMFTILDTRDPVSWSTLQACFGRYWPSSMSGLLCSHRKRLWFAQPSFKIDFYSFHSSFWHSLVFALRPDIIQVATTCSAPSAVSTSAGNAYRWANLFYCSWFPTLFYSLAQLSLS